MIKRRFLKILICFALAFAGALLFTVELEAATAKSLRAEGNRLYRAKRYFEALDKFEDAQKLEPNAKYETFIYQFKEKLRRSGARRPVAKSNKVQIGAEITGGFASYALGDFQKIDLGLAAISVGTGNSGKPTTSGGAFGLEVVTVWPAGWGFSMGYIVEGGAQYKAENKEDFSPNVNERDWSIQYNQARLPVTVFYRWRVARKFALNGGLGFDLVMGKLEYTNSGRISAQSPYSLLYTYSDHSEMQSTGMGFHLSMGGEFIFTKNFSLFANAEYMNAKLDSFEGSYQTTITGTDVNVDGVRALMVKRGGHEQLILGYPTGVAAPAGSRPLEIDSSGFRLRVGLRLLLN